MARDFTSEKLISTIKQRAMVPTSQSTYTNSDFLTIINDTLRDFIVPIIMRCREEFFVSSSDTTVGSSTSFDIPWRSMGDKLRDVLRVSSGGDIYSVARIEPEFLDRFNSNSPNCFNGFYLQADKINLVGQWSTTDSLRLKYFRRPNKVVLSTEVAQITSITGNEATCSSIPSTWTTSDTFDVIKSTPAFASRGDDQAVSSITTTTITFSSIPTGTVVGDYICKADEAPVAQIPYDAYPLLIKKSALMILRDLGDNQSADRVEASMQESVDNLVSLLTNRVEGENRKIVNTHNLGIKSSSIWGA